MNIVIEEIVVNPLIQIEETIEEITITVSEMSMPGPQGEQGIAGKTAYQSALDGGFVGTELEFNTFLSEIDQKLNIADYNDRFKGVFLTFEALNLALPTANAGDSAQVNEVGATDVVNYSWDAEENIWVQSGASGSAATNTDALPEGTSNLYFTTARVLSTFINGVSFLIGTPIVSTDTILEAFGKLQKQITDNNSNVVKNIISNTNTSEPITGTTSETVLFSDLIPANSFKNGDFFNIKMSRVGKIGTAGTLRQRIKINTVNDFSTATFISDNQGVATIINLITIRTFSIENGKLKGLATSGVQLASDLINNNTAISTTPFNPAIDNYIFVVGTLGSASDSMYHSSFLLTN